jgi:hypothetical protein
MSAVTMRRAALIALTALGVSLVADCSATETKAHRQSDQHADVAATIMSRSLDPIPATWAAAEAVGSKGNTTIEALPVDGTVCNRTIVLRITVDKNALTAAVQTVFGPPEIVTAGPTSATQSFVSIRSFGAQSTDQYSCLRAIVPPTGQLSITNARGADCVGG